MMFVMSAVGVTAGPLLRGAIFRYSAAGDGARQRCPHCHVPVRDRTRAGQSGRLPMAGRCPACRARIGPVAGTVELPAAAVLAVIDWQFGDAFNELRKVELGICTRDFGTPCIHRHACIRCPALRPDPAQQPRLQRILANLHDRLAEAEQQGWRGEVGGLQVSIASAEQKLATMADLAARHQVTHLGMPDFRPTAGRTITSDQL